MLAAAQRPEVAGMLEDLRKNSWAVMGGGDLFWWAFSWANPA